MPATLNFRAVLPMLDQMNAIAQVSAAPSTGPKLDNRRVLAGVVDLLIVTAGALVVLYAGDSLTGDRQGALAAVILGWALYYYFALESGAGQTVGKKLMNLRVVSADGRPAGMREIAVRSILRVIDGIGLYIVGLIVMLVTGQRRQRLGDLAAGTIVVDASGPASAVAEPAAPVADAELEVDEDVEADEVPVEEPVATVADPTRTITLPSRPTPPETLSDLVEPSDEAAPEAEVVEAEPVAEIEPEAEVVEAEPVVETEPEADVVEAEPVAETQAEAAPFEVKSFEVEPYHVEPIELESEVPEEPVAEAEEAPEPAEEPLPPAMSPSLEGLAADVAAAQDSGQDEDADEDEPVNVKSVETVSAMDLIMGAAEENAEKSEEDEGPVSA